MLFWLFLALVGIALLISVETESAFSATVVMIGTALVAWWFYDFNILTYIANNIGVVLAGVAAYVVAGAIWSRTKWEFFIRGARRALSEAMSLYGSAPSHFDYYGRQQVPPQISDNKSRFMIWMAYWPVSMLWTLINDPVRRLFEWIYTSTAASLQKSSDRVFSDIRVVKEENSIK